MISRISQINTDRLETAAEPFIKSAGNRLSSAIKSIVESHDRYLAGVAKARDIIGGLFSDAMLAAHLSARLQIMMNAARHKQVMQKRLSLYDSAVDFVAKRAQLSPDKISYLRGRYGDAATNVISSSIDHEIESVAKEATSEIIKQGMHVREAQKYLGERLDAAGLSGTNPYLLNTLVRTQIAIAYSAGQWNALQDPFIQQELWGYEIVTARDDRVRPTHAACDGMKLPKNDPTWNYLWPPLFGDYNCRCIVVEIWNDDSEKLRTENRLDINVGPDNGFNAGRIFAEVA
jgi:SPP1 gp7 family putative phage head morphogenesis protein